MGLWKGRKQEAQAPPGPVQLRPAQRHPFQMLNGYVPLHQPAFSLYRAIREAIPVVDAAVLKLVRLAGGVGVACQDKWAEEELNQFLRTVPAGWNQRGIQTFLDSYLDCLLTCGRAVGEIVPSRDGREIAAVLCGNVSDVEVKVGDSPLDQKLALRRPNGETELLPRQDLLLFTPYHPSPENPYGQSLLHGLPFLSGVLLKIYQTLGENWERAGNVRFAVVYKPEEGLDQRRVQERGKLLAQRWSQAMENTRNGSVRDFVTVGDVEIKVIGGEAPILDSETPVRQILEQLVAKTGLPPFLLGLNWSTTERMSTQQADLLTSELWALRRTVEPAMRKICQTYLALEGLDNRVEIEWDDISLQDITQEAQAALYRAQAEKCLADASQNENS